MIQGKICAAAITVLIFTLPSHSQGASSTQTRLAWSGVAETPALSFEENQGQMNRQALFQAGGLGLQVFLTRTRAVIALRSGNRSAVVRMTPVGASRNPDVSGRDELPGRSNYFAGPRETWRAGIRNFQRVQFSNVYPGIDLAYHGTHGRLEYDWVVRPGANPSAIRLSFVGIRRARIAADGALLLGTTAGELRNDRPVAYQVVGGVQRHVKADFGWMGKGTIGFRLGEYDRDAPLVIDPTLIFSVLIGGTAPPPASLASPAGSPVALTLDAAGNVYLLASSDIPDFPSTGTLPSGSFPRGTRTYVLKINAAGNTLLFSTLIGGVSATDYGGIALDPSGAVYITGEAVTGFPTTSGAYQTGLKGAANAFIAKLTPDGSALVYSTLLGGSSLDLGYRLAVDASGSAYVVGQTTSSDFPRTSNTLPDSCGPVGGPLSGSAFVTKLNPQGSSLVYSTCIQNGSASALALDGSGNVYLAGSGLSNFPTTPGAFRTAFSTASCPSDPPCLNGLVFKLNAAGSAFVYSTFFGSSAGLNAIAVDTAGNAYLTGSARGGGDFVTKNPPSAAYGGGDNPALVAKLNPAGSDLVYSTYLGGSGGGSTGESGLAIATDAQGNAYITGRTNSTDFPLVNPLRAALNGNGISCALSAPNLCRDAFIVKLNSSGNALIYSTYFGGSGPDQGLNIAADSAGNAIVAGTWGSFADEISEFPPGGFQQANGGVGIFVVKVADSGSIPVYSAKGVTNAASFQNGLATGGIATLFGTNLTNAKGVVSPTVTPLPREVNGTIVTFDGLQLPIFAVADVNGQQQINFQVPSGFSYSVGVLAVNNNGSQGLPLQVLIDPAQPAIFTTDGVHGAIQHANGTMITAPSPATKGEVVVVFATGLGSVTPDPGLGYPGQARPLSVTTTTPSATVAGIAAPIQFSGLAPGFVGLNQVNIQIPAGVPSGDQNLVLMITIDNRTYVSPAVKVSVQ